MMETNVRFGLRYRSARKTLNGSFKSAIRCSRIASFSRIQILLGPRRDLACAFKIDLWRDMAGRSITNRTIWTTWYQGLDHAPALVHACLASWRKFNPDWRVVLVDQNSARDWIDLQNVIDLKRRDITPQRTSAFTRLCLLKQYGGVWADATVFCLRPLDTWLPEYYATGFCAFRNPGPDRLFSSWFLAAEVENPIVAALHNAYVKFMNSQEFSNQDTEFGRAAIKALEPILNKNARRTIRWLSPRLQERVQAYPYFILHYTFNKVVLTSPELRALWDQARPLNASSPQSLQDYAREKHALAKALYMIDREVWPLQKLNWRADLTTQYWSGVLKRLNDSLPKQ